MKTAWKGPEKFWMHAKFLNWTEPEGCRTWGTGQCTGHVGGESDMDGQMGPKAAGLLRLSVGWRMEWNVWNKGMQKMLEAGADAQLAHER